MPKNKRLLIFCWALSGWTLGVDAAPQPWADQQCQWRLPIVVSAQSGTLDQRPVVMRWSRVAQALHGTRVRLSSLRLIAGDKLVPYQIDHRNAAGQLVPSGNLRLDPEDELVFVCPSDRETVLHLYGSEEPRPLVRFPSGLKVTSLRDGSGQAHYVLSTADLKIGIQGAGAVDPTVNIRLNHGRGSVVELTWHGQSAIWPSMNWAVYMNGHPFAMERWRSAKLMLDGPVRKVIAVQGIGEVVKKGDGTTDCHVNVTRYFSMFAGVPLYEVEDRLQCVQVPSDWTVTYSDRFFAGSAQDASDVLWDGSTGVLREIRLADRGFQNTASNGLVETQDASAGWYAWYDIQEKKGLAVFYRSTSLAAERTSFQSGWELYSSVNRMSFAYRKLHSPITLWHRFRVMGVANADGQQIATEYGLWSDDTGLPVAIGPLERRR